MGCHLRLIPTVSTVLMLQRYILFFNNKQIIKKKHHAPQYLKQYFASLPEKILPYAAGIIVETTTEYFKLSSSATHHGQVLHSDCCDLLENFYLCGIKHNKAHIGHIVYSVVICLKISIFVVSNTTITPEKEYTDNCDLLENFYLCGIKHNVGKWNIPSE